MMLTLGDRLALARRHASLEQADLAKLLGLSRQSVSNYEREIRTPNEAVLLAWSIHTKSSLDWIKGSSDQGAVA